MKKASFIFYIFFFLVPLLNFCKPRENNLNSKVVASINSEKVFLQEIDRSLDQQFYNVLNQIYVMRMVKINEIINKKVISLESAKYKISPDSLLDFYLYSKIDQRKLLNFAKDIRYDFSGIRDIDTSIARINLNSSIKLSDLVEKFKDFQLKNYLDSLRVTYNVAIDLQPPTMPSNRLNNIEAHFRGNLQSSVTIWLFSDIECKTCKDSEPIYERIFQKYKSKIKFAFSYYSDNVTISSLALECASKQNKFWEVYNFLYNSKGILDIKHTGVLAKATGLDSEQFITEIQDSVMYYKIFENFKRINNAGIYATPSIVINNKLVTNSTSEKEIENVIEYELSKIK